MPNRGMKEGYMIFTAVTHDDHGFENAAAALVEKINLAMEEYDITFLSGPAFKDDPGSRSTCLAAQGAVLRKKKEIKK